MAISKAICVLMGLVMSASYAGCDPLVTNQIHKTDEILSYYVMNVSRSIPGIFGLFIAGITTASLRFHS